MTLVLPRSGSIVLRASQIVRVRVASAKPGPWAEATPPLTRREVDLVARAEEVLKGDYDRAREELRMRVEQYQGSMDWAVPVPGAWSGRVLETGAEFVVFRSGPVDLAAAVREPEQVEGIEVLPETRLAIEAEAQRFDLAKVIGKAKASAPSLGYVFGEYLWARHGTRALTDPGAADLVFSLLESTELAVPARAQLIALAVNGANSVGEPSPAAVNRLVRALFRVLGIPAAAPLHDNVVSPYLPVLVGIAGGVPRAAGEVFATAPDERREAIGTLAKYHDQSRAAPLVAWLRTSP